MGAPFWNFARKAVPDVLVPALVVNSGRPTNVFGKAEAPGGKGTWENAPVTVEKISTADAKALRGMALSRCITTCYSYLDAPTASIERRYLRKLLRNR